jgi:hypothetical protein
MNIFLFSILCLDEDEHPDLELYKHFINYYIDLGIKRENFHIIPCGVDCYKKKFRQFKKINNTHRIPILDLVAKKYDISDSYKLYLKWVEQIDPEDWVIQPDLDEFHDFGNFDKIKDCAQFLQENNYNALRGELLDCISEDLTLREVAYPENLFEQFPIRTTITKHFLSGNIEKILIHKAKINIVPGHHDVLWNPKNENVIEKEDWFDPPPRPTPGVYDTDFKSFHFKWTNVLISRLKNKKQKNLYWQFEDERKRTRDIITGSRFNIIIK